MDDITNRNNSIAPTNNEKNNYDSQEETINFGMDIVALSCAFWS
jgi:hypothetical protein